MRPDLFAGSALRDDSHRILARLANGGSVPAPARQWKSGDALQRSQIAAVVALLAAIAAAWAWLQGDGEPAPASPRAVAHSEPPRQPADAIPPQAAAIDNEAPRAAPSLTAAPITQAASPAPAEVRAVRPRAAKAAPHTQASVPAIDNDEDVTLLTAMLKHGKQQKPSATPPKD